MKSFSEYAFERANQDYIVSNTFLRSATQAAILVNGGAATAMLAVVSRLTDHNLLTSIALALAAYAIGVFFAATMMMIMVPGLEHWAFSWQIKAERGKNEELPNDRHAARWYWLARVAFALSMAAFVCGSLIAVWGFTNVK